MSWASFRDQVLAERRRFKGIFVQEVAVDWTLPLYQRPQHMCTALGRLGYLAIYRTSDWGADKVGGFREVAQNVWLTNQPEVRDIEGAVRSFYSTYPNPVADLQRSAQKGIVLYEYVDHLDPQISGDAQMVERLVELKDFALGGGADYVVATARALADEVMTRVPKERCLLVPNGVDTRHYRDARHRQTRLPEALADFRSRYASIVGYFGAIAPWLWYQALGELAALRRDLGFVFLGPDYYGGSARLPRGENVLALGPVEYDRLPAYARQFDVCWIPFAPGEIARTTSPLKLFEYFALEKPVIVTSDMVECLAFPEVLHGASALALSDAIDRGLSIKDDPAFKARLGRLAEENDWLERARAVAVVFDAVGGGT